MASYPVPLRKAIEAVCLGAAGATRTMEPGRFALTADDVTVDDQPVDSAERRLDVVLGMPTAIRPYNPVDGFVLQRFPLTLRLSYAYTDAGGDATETVGEQDGSSVLDAIRGRAETDRMDLQRVLEWHENLAAMSVAGCTVIGCWQLADQPAGFAVRGQRVIVEIPYALSANVTAGATSLAP